MHTYTYIVRLYMCTRKEPVAACQAYDVVTTHYECCLVHMISITSISITMSNTLLVLSLLLLLLLCIVL